MAPRSSSSLSCDFLSPASGEVREGSIPLLRIDGPDRTAQEEWRRGVGPALFMDPDPGTPPRERGPSPMRAAAATAGGHRFDPSVLRVVSWNVRVGAGRLSEFLASLPGDAARAGSPGAPLVVLVQEALRRGGGVPSLDPSPPPPVRTARRIADPLPGGAEPEDVVAVARHFGLSLLYVPSMRNGGRSDPLEDRGNAILSTLPLSHPFAIELPLERQRRVVAGARVRLGTPDGGTPEVGLLSVHLENRPPWGRFWRLPPRGRARQAEALLHLLEGAEGGDAGGAAPAFPSGTPILLGGDLNSWWGQQGEPAVRRLRARFPLPRTLPAEPTHHWELGMDRQSDYLLARAGASWGFDCLRHPEEWGSDHWPLIGSLRLEPPTAPDPGG